MSPDSDEFLPGLLYVGDVPVESSYHGSALIYRLLADYPTQRLRIVETSLGRSLPERRLPGVSYGELYLGPRRPLQTRFAPGYRVWLACSAAWRQRQLPDLLQGFRPQAVLTVAHGFSWRAAARFATEQQLPLHIICHDDLSRATGLPARVHALWDREFAQVYNQSASRLCVSPFMRDVYRERYGADGQVLYPSRAAETPEHRVPPGRLGGPVRSLTVAFGGTINSSGYVLALRQLSITLATIGGRLLIFGPLTAADARREGLDLANVECRGLLSSASLMEQFREEVDVLFVPLSFAPEDRPNMEISFPSKLTDYTAVGIPLLICGPEYSSGVRWARANPGVAELLTSDDTHDLRNALERLARDADHRVALAKRALDVGRRYFSPDAAREVFHGALLGKPARSQDRTRQFIP